VRLPVALFVPVLSVRKGLRRKKSRGAGGRRRRSLRCPPTIEASTLQGTLCRECAGGGWDGLFLVERVSFV
jgi:hypothetical protein